METFSDVTSVALDQQSEAVFHGVEMEDLNLDKYDNILELDEAEYPQFTLAKNKARLCNIIADISLRNKGASHLSALFW